MIVLENIYSVCEFSSLHKHPKIHSDLLLIAGTAREVGSMFSTAGPGMLVGMLFWKESSVDSSPKLIR